MEEYAKAPALTHRLFRRFPPSHPCRRYGLRDDALSRLRDEPDREGALSRLRDEPGGEAVFRLRDRRGETMAETLISLLIIVTALTILAGGITTGARVNKQADTKYAVVFPPPMHGGEAHFTKDQYDVSFRLSLRGEQVYEELSGRLALAPAADDTGKTIEMKPLRVNVRRELALDRNGSELTWRILYVLEGVDENGTEDETEPVENQIGE